MNISLELVASEEELDDVDADTALEVDIIPFVSPEDTALEVDIVMHASIDGKEVASSPRGLCRRVHSDIRNLQLVCWLHVLLVGKVFLMVLCVGS